MVQNENRRDFFIGVDSDGCAFDTMEIKHKECFIPQIIRHYNLQAVSSLARETAEFINLYSIHRGVNRFPGLVLMLEWLARRPEVIQRGIAVQVPERLRQWIATESRWGNPALERAIQGRRESGEAVAELEQALAWSEDVNSAVDQMVYGVPPFPGVRDFLAAANGQAEVVVCSATPRQALQREWSEHQLTPFVRRIYGQEDGSKRELLSRHVADDAADRCLMIGDSPGDYRAAEAAGCLFFPIEPGAEIDSWRMLCDEGLERFLTGRFSGEYQQQLVRSFFERLPENPPWETQVDSG